MSKDPRVQCELVYIGPGIQDRTLSFLINLPLFVLESKLCTMRDRCVVGSLEATAPW